MIKTIAEIGCNHKGDFEIAKKLISIAANYCEVDVVKFQKRNNLELLTPEQYNSPHPNPHNSYGKTYGEHREYLEFSVEQHYELKKYCEECGVDYCSSVWDFTSAKEIISLNPKLIKVPSACNTNLDMLNLLATTYTGEIHCSIGMTTNEEISNIVNIFNNYSRNNDLILYHCISGYPVDFHDCSLKEIENVKRKYGSCIKEIGFSGHHRGIAIDNAAIALGATWIERHFTLDRTWKGTDHAASLEPDGLRKLVRDLQATFEALKFKEKEILDIEEVQRKKLKCQLK